MTVTQLERENVAPGRWWGAEVSFSSGMDDVFGVTNNKQHAQGLNDVSKKEWKDWDFDDDGLSTDEIKDY